MACFVFVVLVVVDVDDVQAKMGKSDDREDNLMEREKETDEMEMEQAMEQAMEQEMESETKKNKLKPQEELLESWYITLDDRVESLTNHLRSLSKKRSHVIGMLSAFVESIELVGRPLANIVLFGFLLFCCFVVFCFVLLLVQG